MGPVGGLGQHRPKSLGHVGLTHRHHRLGRRDTLPDRPRGHAGRRAGGRLLPHPQVPEPERPRRACATVRSTRSGGTHSQELDLDILVIDLGMAGVPVLDPEPVDEWLDERGVERLLAVVVEPRLVPAAERTRTSSPSRQVSPPNATARSRPWPASTTRRYGRLTVSAPPPPLISARSGRHGMDRSIIPLAVCPSHV